MFEVFLTVYFVVSTVFAAPVPNDDSLGNVLRVSSDDTLCDGDGSCGFNFTSSDTYKARKTFNDYIFDTTVSVIYLYLKEKSSDQNDLKQYLPEETYRNGLQEWIWLKRERMYEELSLPIDLDSLTFTITKYGTRQMDIPWSLSSNCHLNSRISYDNETRNVLNYLWTSITKNETGSLLCHRSFDDKTLLGTKAIWFITTVWIGYDFDCFLIDSLMNEEYEVTEQTKYDITEILTVVLGLLAYMHPFIIHIVEIAQPSINTELNKYYKNKDQYEKPFGVTRVMQKIFFTPCPNLSGANPLFSKTDIPTQTQKGINLPNMGASGSNTNNTSHNPNTDHRETSINEDDTNEKSKLLGKNDKGRNYTV
ncbi:Hypothetical predicted protein [Mytilus galloprovincialis]|uniref:Uncharacterized protein n=1 Tax=Mytilus galloprovincialis TaxID=29158 RepID=A0A8B6G9E3_MYTGA|nr:Hypothetical predicted protein [Mytilus galloprovincialis]